MEGFSKKEYVRLTMPAEEIPLSDQKRIELALNTLGYEPVTFPLKVLRKLYPLCRNAGFDITVTLVHRESDWVVTDVEAGDTTAHHYGLAVDYGSTTIVMQLVDLNSGSVVAEEKEYAAVYAAAEESATGNPLYFSQTDIHPYLDTKAAAYTMVDCLLEAAGIDANDLSLVYLSGAFPAHSDLESAITIGMFPDLPRENYRVLNNSSLDGARTVLLDYTRLAEAKMLAGNIYCVQFASIPYFLVRMQATKFIPHTDRKRFPSIQA